jgi:hypothetical protein
MTTTEEIAIRLGIKNADLKAALADAGVSIKKFKKEGESGPNEGLIGTLKKQTQGLQQLRELLSSGVMAAAVKGFFNLAIDSANKSSDATDQNAARVRAFGRDLDEMKGVAGRVAVAVVGSLNFIGEKIGDLININRAFNNGGVEAVKRWKETQDVIETTAKLAEEAERRVAEVRKRNGVEFLAITKELAEIEKKAADQKLKGLDVYETERNLLVKLSELRQKLANFDGDAIERRRIVLEIARTQLAAEDATLAVKKDQVNVEKKLADDRKKAAEEQKKNQEEELRAYQELSKRRALDAEREIELTVLQAKNAATLTTAERARIALLEQSKELRIVEVELEDLIERKITEGLIPAEVARLTELDKQRKKLVEQIDAKLGIAAATRNDQIPAEQQVVALLSEEVRLAQMLTEEKQRQAQIERSRTGTIKRVGDERTLNDVQLNTLIQNLGTQLAPIKQADSLYAGVGQRAGTYKSVEQYLLQQELDKAVAERNLRRDFAQTVGFLGEEGAQKRFAPGDYDRLSQLLNPDAAKKQASDITAIAGTLRNLFPDQYAGLR